jgi:hypothetical protein
VGDASHPREFAGGSCDDGRGLSDQRGLRQHVSIVQRGVKTRQVNHVDFYNTCQSYRV